MSTTSESDLWQHVQTRTDLQEYIDGAFADAMRRMEDGPEVHDPADYVKYSLAVQRRVREALMGDGIKAVEALTMSKDEGLIRSVFTVALDAVFGKEPTP